MMVTEKNKNFRFENFYSPKTLIWTIFFGAVFLIYEFLMLPKSRISLTILARHLSEGSYWRFLFLLSLSITAFCLFLSFVYASFAVPYKYRIIFFIIFSLLIITEYGYYVAFEQFFRFQDIEIAIYAKNADIFTNAISKYFNYLAIFPIVVYGILLLKLQEVYKHIWTPLFAVIILFVTFFFATTYFTKNTFYLHSFNHGISTLVSFPVIWYVGTINDTAKNSHYYVSRTQVESQSPKKPKNNVVFIIDESVRSDYLSINGYGVSTTPTLEKLSEKGFVKNWGTAVSGTTCSVTSNGLLLTGLNDLPDINYSIFKLPTIFQYAKAMGFKTFYFDGQVSGLWNGKSADVANYGEWITAKELGENVENRYDVDAEIAKRIKQIVNNSDGNFIWVNKYGVHQSSIDSYPNNETDITSKYTEAIRYNSESFFNELFDDENFGKNTIYIYTSDHGRNLDEEKGTATHCSNTRSEAKVPLLLLSSPQNLPDVDTGFKASHSNIFATLLDLMNFPEEKRKYNYSISLLEAKESDSKRRFYFVGDLNLEAEGKTYVFDD